MELLDIAVGDRFVVFPGGAAPRNGLTGVVQAWQLWSINGNSITTSFTPTLPLQEVLEPLAGGPTPSR